MPVGRNRPAMVQVERVEVVLDALHAVRFAAVDAGDPQRPAAVEDQALAVREEAGHEPPFENWRAAPPSGGTDQIPCRLRSKTIWSPLGDQRGVRAAGSPEVIWTGSPSPTGLTQSCGLRRHRPRTPASARRAKARRTVRAREGREQPELEGAALRLVQWRRPKSASANATARPSAHAARRARGEPAGRPTTARRPPTRPLQVRHEIRHVLISVVDAPSRGPWPGSGRAPPAAPSAASAPAAACRAGSRSAPALRCRPRTAAGPSASRRARRRTRRCRCARRAACPRPARATCRRACPRRARRRSWARRSASAPPCRPRRRPRASPGRSREP